MAKESKCDGCKKLETRVAALADLVRGPRMMSYGVAARCLCNLFATRRVVISHPVAGETSQLCCSTCVPRDVYGDNLRKLEFQQFGSTEDVLWAEMMNEALCG